MRYLYIVIAILSSSIAQGQIVFDQDDYPRPGISLKYYQGWSDSINFSADGPNKTFDFSNIIMGIEDTVQYVFMDPSNTGFGSHHPNATVAYKSETQRDSATGDVVLEFWQFIEVSSFESKYTGITARLDTGVLFSNNPPTGLVEVHTSYDTAMQYLSRDWQYGAFVPRDGFWRATIGPLVHGEHTEREVHVDCWGTFKNPWNEFNAMRFEVTEYISMYDSVNGQLDDASIDSNYYYEYWVEGLGHYIARAYTDQTHSNLWLFEIADQRNPVGIAESSTNESDFSIYPNPTSDILYLNYSGNATHYQIFDIEGRMLMQSKLPSGDLQGYSIDVSALEAGTYAFVLMESGRINRVFKVLIE
jgi:hypothetical protein